MFKILNNLTQSEYFYYHYHYNILRIKLPILFEFLNFCVLIKLFNNSFW